MALYEASPTDFILPFTGHPIWGAWIGAHFDRSYWVEARLYVGVIVALLALVAVVFRKSAQLGRGTTLLFLIMVVVAFVLSLGVVLRWLSHPVTIDIPLGSSIFSDLTGMIPLPSYFLYKLLPFYSSIRVPMRYGVFVNLFLIVLAGGGAAWILDRFGDRRQHFIGLLLVAVVIFDFCLPGGCSQQSNLALWISGLQLSPTQVASFSFHLAPRAVKHRSITL